MLREILGGIAGSLFGGIGGGDDKEVTQKNEPWEGIQSYLLHLYGRGQGLSGVAPPDVAASSISRTPAARHFGLTTRRCRD